MGALPRNVEQRVRAQGIQQPLEQQAIEIKAQQRAVDASRVFGQMFGNGGSGAVQRRFERWRHFCQNGVIVWRVLGQARQAAAQAVKRLVNGLGR